MSAALAAALGALTGFGSPILLRRVLPLKLRRDLSAVNAGDHRPLLAGYADDAVLRFNDGDHRWAGEHRGREAIERFLRNFVAAGRRGERRELFTQGPPRRMALVVPFDDRALGSEGEELYRNRTVLAIRTRWGRIVEHEDLYEDTERIEAFERRLRALGVEPAIR